MKREEKYKEFKETTKKLIQNNFKVSAKPKAKENAKDAGFENRNKKPDPGEDEIEGKIILDGRQHFTRKFLDSHGLEFVDPGDFSWNKYCNGELDKSLKKRGIESKFSTWDGIKEEIFLSQISKNKWVSDEQIYKKY